MKKLFIAILILVSVQCFGQNPYYIGSQYLKWSGRMLLQDSSRNGTYDTLASRKWVRSVLTSGSGNTNSNIGSGFRWAVPNTNNVKTFFSGYGSALDSTTNSNALTIKADTAAGGLSTRLWRQKGIDSVVALIGAISTPTFQQTLTAGSVLTTSNSIDVAANTLTFDFTNFSSLTLSPTIMSFNSFNGVNTQSTISATSDASASGNQVYVHAKGGASSQGSFLATGAGNVTINATNSLALTGAAITGVQINPATYGYLLIDASGNVKKTSAGLTVALTDGATISTDASLGLTTGATYVVTLGGNRTIANPTNLIDGQKLIYILIQDATGSRTVTWGSNFNFSSDTPAPTLSTAIGAIDVIGFVYRATGTKLFVTGVNLGH